MKKVISVIMVMLLALVSLTACQTKESSKIENSVTYKETTATQGNTDANSSYVGDSSKTSKESPLPKGEWISYYTRQREGSPYVKSEIRVNKITTEYEDSSYVYECIDKYRDTEGLFTEHEDNAGYHYGVIDFDVRLASDEGVSSIEYLPCPTFINLIDNKGYAVGAVKEKYLADFSLSKGEVTNKKVLFILDDEDEAIMLSIERKSNTGDVIKEYLSLK